MNFKFYEPRFTSSKPLHEEKPQSVKDLRFQYDPYEATSGKRNIPENVRAGHAKLEADNKTASIFDKLNYPKNAKSACACPKRHATTVCTTQNRVKNRLSKEMTVVNLDSSI